MRMLIGAAAMALACATPAFAQADQSPAGGSQCAFAPAPTLIDGAASDRDAMTATGEQVNAWLQARQQEEVACQQQLVAEQARVQTMINVYNASGRERQSIVQAWNGFLTSNSGLPLAAAAPAGPGPTALCTFAAPPSWLYTAAPSRAEMRAKTQEVDTWRALREQQEAACQQEITTLQTSLQSGATAFNASNQERVTIVQAWNAEVQEFGSSAAPANRRRERGGVNTGTDD